MTVLTVCFYIVYRFLNAKIQQPPFSMLAIDGSVSAGRNNYQNKSKQVRVNSNFLKFIKNKGFTIKTVVGNSMLPIGIYNNDIVAIDNNAKVAAGDIVMLDYAHKYPNKFKLREIVEINDNEIVSNTYSALYKRQSKHNKDTLIGKVVASTTPI